MLSAAPSDDLIVSWVADGHAALVEVLSSAPPDVQCWTFLPAPSPLAFWARRQAHETAVHRVDAELAAGAPPTPFDPAFAVDGTDEVLLGFFARPRRGGALDVSPGTIGLEATDVGSAWTVRISPEGIETKRGVDESDLSVRGSASDLYLFAMEPAPVGRPPERKPRTGGPPGPGLQLEGPLPRHLELVRPHRELAVGERGPAGHEKPGRQPARSKLAI